MWNFQCSSFDHIPNPLDFIQSTAFTPYDDTWTVQCPPNYVITGHYSEHNNDKEDRRWTFNCGSVTSGGMCTTDCATTDYVNDYDDYFHYVVPEGRALVGVHSDHDNGKEYVQEKTSCKHDHIDFYNFRDRIWTYTHCLVTAC